MDYRTLSIVLPNHSYQTNGSHAVPLGVLPIHLVRGNFAHYSEDRPLFGRYTGTFWRPAHVKGNREVGVVVKDYAVEVAD